MLFRKFDKERDRYYLLPGMGKRLARKKRRVIWTWSLLAALVVSALLAYIIYILNRDLPRH